MMMLALTWLCLTSPSLSSPVLADLGRLMGPLGSLGPLGHLLQGAVAGGGGAAGGAGAGAAGAAGAAAGGVGGVVGGLPVTTSPVVPAMMMSTVLPGIGIGLLAGTVIAELLIGKKGGKKHQAGYEEHYEPAYGYSLYGHDQYGGHHRAYY